MPDTHQVKCHTPDNADPDRRIQGLGGDWGWLPIDQIIRKIEINKDLFWTYVGQKGTAVVVRERNRKKYLTTLGDDWPPNNLLNLPHCPGR